MSAATGVNDFDFLVGDWNVEHRRLESRLTGCTDWIEFTGTCRVHATLAGAGNVDDNWIDLPAGAYRAMSVRAFDIATGQWSIWWLDGRTPSTTLDPPMRGRFAGGVGTFLATETIDGRTICVRFRWTDITSSSCRWEQAFSDDAGETWETNWTMQFERSA